MPVSWRPISLPLLSLKLIQSHPQPYSLFSQLPFFPNATYTAVMKVTILPSLVVNYLNSFQSMARVHLTQLSALFWKHSSFQMPSISSWASHLYLQLYLLLWVSDMPPDFSSDCFTWMSIRNCWHHVPKRKLLLPSLQTIPQLISSIYINGISIYPVARPRI